MAGECPFRSWEWLSSWWETLGADREPMVLLAHDARGQLVGIAPWYVHRSTTRGSVLRFLGDGKASTDYMSLLVRPEHEVAVTQEFGKRLLARRQGQKDGGLYWNALDFDGVGEGDRHLDALMGTLGLQDHVVQTPAENAWVLTLSEDWDVYLSQRSKRRRTMLRRIVRDYVATGRAVLHVAETEKERDEFLASLVRLHTLRRQELGCGGCFAHEGFQEFIELASQRLMQAGKLRMMQMTIDGEVAANALGMQQGDTYYHYQCGFDPRFSEHGPGWLQNVLIVRDVMTHGFRKLDFLRGDEPYKRQLGGEQQCLVRLRVAAPTAISRTRHSLALLMGKAYHAMPGVHR